MGERVESMNAKPSMFQAGISNKFTRRHGDNFHDTTLTAASAAKQRAERKLEKQAEAIDKQQKKIETEMKKIEEITLKLHRQQVREARRLRNRLHFAATRVQSAFRRSQERWRATRSLAATRIQCRWRGAIARAYAQALRDERYEQVVNRAAVVISRSLRVFASRMMREQLIVEREYAATLIQSIVRMARAREMVQRMLAKKREAQERHRAATVIQCNVKSYMTRLIYLDVLYVICRIQAAIRGFLIRRRLQWVTAIDIDGICKFQALARGFLTRQRLGRFWKLRLTESHDDSREHLVDHSDADGTRVSDRIATRPSSVSSQSSREPHDREDTRAMPRDKRIALKAAGAAKPQPKTQTGAVIKRSYWLPAGASFSKRLPVLPASKRSAVVDFDDDEELSNGHLDMTSSRRAWTPKKRNQRNRPSRLAPVTPPGGNSDGGSLSARMQTDAEAELQLVNQALEEKLRREEELKHKLLCRKAQEKRRVEHEQRLKREQENEENERKLMEREEKLARLLLKVLHRRSKEVKIKKQSAEQQREERERIAMAREERQTRLLGKLAARQALLRKSHLGSTVSGSAASTATGSPLPSASSSTATPPARMRDNRSRSELHAKHATSGTRSVAASESPQHDDDDEDMSFLDIDFKIPESMQKTKKASTKGGVGAGAGAGSKKAGRKLSKLGSDTKFKNGSSASSPPRTETSDEGNQEDISSKAKDVSAFKAEVVVGNDFEFDYGSEFEDIIDETKLGRLIC